MPSERKQPNCEERISFFERRIKQEKSSIHLSWILAGAVVACGIGSALLTFFLAPDSGKMVGAAGSGLVTLLSGFPLKDYLTQKIKISEYEYYRTCYENLNVNPEKAEDMEIDRIEGIYWDLRKKLAGA